MLERIGRKAKERFAVEKRVLSFAEYLDLIATAPPRYLRDATRYVKDLFDHYGRRTVRRATGEETRFALFDQPWNDGRGALVGHERVQMEVYRALENFAREGRMNRLILLHGPNGSAKSTFARCLIEGIEQYSTLPEGAVYRFSWVFPSARTERGNIGFGGRGTQAGGTAGFAHLPDEEVDARIACELRDHPLLLLPLGERDELLRELGSPDVPEWIAKGGLCAKCNRIHEALLAANDGDLEAVLRHVRVERYTFSRRYRVGTATIGPQMTVDASERQITADRSLAALPASLQTVSLFEPMGELVDASGGICEFSDLLKRPLDAFKYLLLTIETGEVTLGASILHLNTVFIASSNEGHLGAFKEHPEFNSFRGRLELIRVPYLRDVNDEREIYDRQIVPQVARHVAPHATEMAALFAVLSRMRKPQSDRYGKELADVVGSLTPLEKAELLGSGAVPSRLTTEEAKELRAHVADIAAESDDYPHYEGRFGASPREIRTVLLDAAQHPGYACLSPLAVLDELEDLCRRVNEYDFLKQEALPGGYHDHASFLRTLRDRLADHAEDELRSATGVVDEKRYLEMLDRYVVHVSHFVKGEKIFDRVTGVSADPDAATMAEVERALESKGDPVEFRRNVISKVAAWAIDHPGKKVVYSEIFADYLVRLREATYAERKKAIAAIARALLAVLAEGSAPAPSADDRKAAMETLARLRDRFHYCDSCAKDAVVLLLKERLADA